MSRLSRRGFLKNSAALSALAMTGYAANGKKGQALAVPPPAKRGANETIRVAVAGIHGRGRSHIGSFAGMDNVEIACLVDPDSRLFDERTKMVQEASKGRSDPKCVQDIRRMLDDKNVDVVSIATPNHWHSLLTIWACQAGKDVYVEKPMSHNIHEGRVAVDIARKYKRIVQHGTQRRSDRKWAHVMAAIASGKLGKLLIARGLCYKAGGRGSIGYKPHRPAPDGLDFNIWLGPAHKQPYHDNLVHYNWHWFYEFGNGDQGNQGVHQMDVARWGIPGATLPRSVISLGGRLGYQDQADAASSLLSLFDFGETQLIFETRGLPSKRYRGTGGGNDIRNIFHLEAGIIDEQTFYPNDSDKPAELPVVDFDRGPGGNIFANFIACVRSRNQDELDADILEGHYSSALCHLGSASYRTGTKVPYRPATEALADNPDGTEAWERMEQYLAENGVDLEKEGYTLGRKLTIDPRTEMTTDPDANVFLTRNYRAGFEVPASA